MKNFVYMVSLVLLGMLVQNNFVYAQSVQDTVFLNLSVHCTKEGAVQFSPDTVVEGQTYTMKSRTLPSSYSSVQGLYDALVGTQFYFQNGSLDKNIYVYFILSDINCGTGLYDSDASTGAKFFFHAVFEVDTIGNGQGFVTGSYHFKNGKYAVLKIKRTTKFNNFVEKTGVDLNKALKFVYVVTTGDFTSSGITTSEDTSYVTAMMSHFSTVAGGNQSTLTDVKNNDIDNNVPANFVLKQNYPNPFNPSTTIQYALPEKTYIELNVYNILGVKVASLVKGIQSAGNHSVTFEASNLASGLYFYELKTKNSLMTRKMLLLK